MEPTYSSQGIILSRQSWQESGLKVLVFSKNGGIQSFVVRGGKKIQSKMSGHLDCFNLADLMIVRGRQFDYLGGAKATEFWPVIKSDLLRIWSAGQALGFLSRVLKKTEKKESQAIFNFTKVYLNILNQKNFPARRGQLLALAYIFKIFSFLGYQPELRKCLICGRSLNQSGNFLSFHQGGLICPHCRRQTDTGRPVSASAIKILRAMLNQDLKTIKRLDLPPQLIKEIERLILNFVDYQLA